ncbi:hydrogenase maturation protease [Rhodovulum iodosum]|uniref:hydrogenase maturation protease n=1 Tax=Rhodovulum iodosum TaxID=68291 RepID=UPI0014756BAA|nr:hydrogenase maturation protease [Rhodovulum robiginosum]
MSEAPLFIGVGNPFRRDDGVGPWVADELARRGHRALTHGGDGAGLIELFRGRGAVTLIDATETGAAPGTILTLDAAAGPVGGTRFRRSTHSFGLAEAVETARLLGLLPPRLSILGIEGADFAPGEGLSPAVSTAAKAAVDRLDAG